MIQLILWIICWVIVIKANLEWDGTIDCDEDCKHCPFPPCNDERRKKPRMTTKRRKPGFSIPLMNCVNS